MSERKSIAVLVSGGVDSAVVVHRLSQDPSLDLDLFYIRILVLHNEFLSCRTSIQNEGRVKEVHVATRSLSGAPKGAGRTSKACGGHVMVLSWQMSS